MNAEERKLFYVVQTRLFQSSLKLMVINEQGQPVRPASGVLIEKDGRSYVLSVGHALSGTHWSIETDFILEAERQVLHFALPDPVVYNQKSTQSHRRVDFAWTELDRKRLRQSIPADKSLMGRATEPLITVYRGEFVEPNHDMDYGFGAYKATPFFDNYRKEQDRVAVGEMFMAYDGIDQRNGFYRFQLARKHQGDPYYQGSSGSPIAGFDGSIIALVQGASPADPKTGERENIIWGVPIRPLLHLVLKQASCDRQSATPVSFG